MNRKPFPIKKAVNLLLLVAMLVSLILYYFLDNPYLRIAAVLFSVILFPLSMVFEIRDIRQARRQNSKIGKRVWHVCLLGMTGVCLLLMLLVFYDRGTRPYKILWSIFPLIGMLSSIQPGTQDYSSKPQGKKKSEN